MKFSSSRSLFRVAVTALLAGVAQLATAAITDIYQAPLIVASPSTVKANLLFVLDDSGSMNFDFMPDHINGDGSPDPKLCRSSGATPVNSGNFANTCCIGGDSSNACYRGTAPFGTLRGQPPFHAASFNGMAYDPTIYYAPPILANGNSWPSQTSANTAAWTSVKNDAYNKQNTSSINLITQFPDTEWCVDNTWADCLRNDNYILPGTVNGKSYTVFHAVTATGDGILATGAPDNPSTTAKRDFGPYYYNIVAAEYCDAPNLRNCQSTQAAPYTYAAAVRWCKTDADARSTSPGSATCQATRNSTFSFARFPSKFFTAGTAATAEVPSRVTFTITANPGPSCNVSVTAVTVSGVNLLAAATTASNKNNTVGTNIAAQINARTNSLPAGSSTAYTASTTNSGRTVTITAPAGVNTTAKVSFTRTPTTCSLPLDNASPAFSGYAAATPAVPGSYAGRFERVDIVPSRTTYPKALGRTDCVTSKTSCTYDEEMTNFANWWTYYHTRMQSMKSSAATAFAAVGNDRRVGYLSINNNTTKDFLNLDVFDSTHKTNWYAKLTGAQTGNSTPLRTALSSAGKLYAGKYNGSTFNGSTVKEPMEYSCQKNFTILSTDGFWNESNNPTQLDGSVMGNQDGSPYDPPIYDGNATPNTLADVAAYYFRTDLRTGTTGSTDCTNATTGADICGNSTNPAVKDEVQVMKTFTLGLGASGFMQFSPTYVTDTTGDFFAVRKGSAPDPANGICSWQTSGVCTWPIPVNNTLTTIDDLWHAAVNGGGTYFSATNPSSLNTGLTNALDALKADIGAAAAATTSNPNVSAGENQVFLSTFTTAEWSGDLKSQRLDVSLGTVQSTVDWSARDLLETNNSRNIYMYSKGAASNRKTFDWASLDSTERDNFSLSYITTAGRSLTQFCSIGPTCLKSSDQSAAAGSLLVDFLRGDRTNEGIPADTTKFFRQRAYRLGDIVNSEAVFVGKSLLSYTDTDYDTLQAKAATRTRAVYVGANDGMLHAFNADTGAELWAYVPQASLPNMYKLADKQYGTQHQYFADGTAVVQDVYVGSKWVTMLVAGMGAGGRSYYAIDVTDPDDPKPMWEFTDDNLGLTIGKPEIGKLKDGKWVVVFGSGYNNVSSNPSKGDGVGRLFVLDAEDGTIIRTISTNVGTPSTPSGLAHIRAWVDNSEVDNTIQRVYGGDNLGNVWRFDIDDKVGAPGYEAVSIATLKDKYGAAQPVTSRPELGLAGTAVMVFVGTGRYLGQADLTDASPQSIYGIKDSLGTTGVGNPRLPASKFVEQTLSTGTCPSGSSVCSAGDSVRSNGSPNPINLATDGGWFVDLPVSRERVNTDPQLALGTLVVTTNVIEPGNLCKVGGSSWINFFDYRTGGAVKAAKGVTSVPLGDAIATRPSLVKLPDNRVISLTRMSNATTVSKNVPTDPGAGATRRLSWRDLQQQ